MRQARTKYIEENVGDTKVIWSRSLAASISTPVRALLVRHAKYLPPVLIVDYSLSPDADKVFQPHRVVGCSEGFLLGVVKAQWLPSTPYQREYDLLMNLAIVHLNRTGKLVIGDHAIELDEAVGLGLHPVDYLNRLVHAIMRMHESAA